MADKQRENVVEIIDFAKEFRSPFMRKRVAAVRGVSLEIKRGEVYGLIGPNGSGKSTTMKALLGLLQPSQGSCKVFGHEAIQVDARSQIGYLPENPYFFKHQTARETLLFYGRLCGMAGATLKTRVLELLEMVDLLDAADRRLAGFSKGMLQRVGLAQALIQKPHLVVLDEPTAGVDPIGSRQIRDLILSLKKRGFTVFLCSHLLEQVQEVCDRVGVIYQGKMVAQGSVDELCKHGECRTLKVQDLGEDCMGELGVWLESQGARLLSCELPQKSLEQVFIDLVTNKVEEKV